MRRYPRHRDPRQEQAESLRATRWKVAPTVTFPSRVKSLRLARSLDGLFTSTPEGFGWGRFLIVNQTSAFHSD